MRRPFICLALILLAGCVGSRPAVVPVPFDQHLRNGPAQAKGLVIFLPGFGDTMGHFVDNGFVAALEDAGSPYDAIAVDMHFGYYRTGEYAKRLHDDVIVPAKQQGYREIWLVGISMGGLGVLGYPVRYPGDVQGVIALAPFMGSGDVLEEVHTAGGLKAWTPRDPQTVADPEERFYFELWAHLKRYADDPASAPPLYLGYGSDDRLAPTAGLLADVLPADRVRVRDGGHKWRVWRPLFADFVEALFLPR